MTIDQIIANTEALDINQVLQSSFEDTKEIMADLQADQMLHGKNANGNQIGVYASEEYAQQKHIQSSVAGFGNVDLRREGDFYRGITVNANANSVTITSRDGKTDKLVAKYGEEIFGLNNEYKALYLEDLSPIAIHKIKEQILK